MENIKEKNTDYKICPTCNINKNIIEWGKNKYTSDGLSSQCLECKNNRAKIYRQNNRSRLKIKSKKFHQKYKFIVIAYYSFGEMCCRKCRNSDLRVLQLDHINGDGYKDRKSKGSDLYRILIKQDFPEGYQVLCPTCNIIKKIENQEAPNVDKNGNIIIRDGIKRFNI